MNISESKKFDLNSEPLASFFQRALSDIKGYAQVNIDEQETINDRPPFRGKHPLEFIKQFIDVYHKDLLTPEEVRQIVIFPFPCKSPESQEQKQKYKDEMTMINSDPIKPFFQLVINDITGFINFLMEQENIAIGRHPAFLLIEFLDSYRKDITFTPTKAS